jgi:6-phosphogluconate dehydrogenase
MKKADIGLVGLAVMGENLVLNMERHGFTVAVFNRTVAKVDNFLAGRGKGKNIIGAHSIEELVASLKTPRKVMLMVKAGQAVDDFIELLIPHLEKGDIIIDGGNSHFPDTTRRTEYMEAKGLLYIGTGVSGGEEGALNDRPLCPADLQPPGRMSSRFSRRLPPKLKTARPVATGSAKKAPVTL